MVAGRRNKLNPSPAYSRFTLAKGICVVSQNLSFWMVTSVAIFIL